MKKFKILKYNRKFFAIYGISYNSMAETFFQFLLSIRGCLYAFTISTFAVITCSAFAHKNWIDFDEALEGILVCIAGIQAAGMFLSMGFQVNKLFNLHIKMQELIEHGRYFSNEKIFFKKKLSI